MIDKLLAAIGHRIPGQIFSLKRIRNKWTEEEMARFAQEIVYFSECYSFELLVEGYVYFTQNYIDESKYFETHKKYRCQSFEEVECSLYSDERNMTLYMLGLCMAEYLWETTLRIHRFFESLSGRLSGRHYLEIGPGHGKYFLEAYNLQRFNSYTGIDVSKTAIDMSEDYMRRYARKDSSTSYSLLCADATRYETEERYDFIVIQEVLEHIEDPLGMLRSLRELLTEDGKIYALMPINAPSPAHIFRFESIEHVKQIVTDAGLQIEEEEYITANNVTLEEAEKNLRPINACLLLKRGY